MAIDVRTICLGVLSLGPATGYEIKKRFEEGPLGYVIEASFGAIYPALGRLTDEGLVDCRTQAQEGKPDRKIYSLTPAGVAAFREALLIEPGPDRFRSEFLFLLMFAGELPPDRLKHLIDARLAEYRERLASVACEGAKGSTPSLEFSRGQAIAVYKAMIEHMEQNRHLLEQRVPQRVVDAAE